jgi:MtN3 and saliva related transmembrane protein
MFSLTDLIGNAASATAVVIMVPQVIKMVRTKDVRGLSLGMMVLYFVNCSLWLAYGRLLGAAPIVFCNVIAVVVGAVQLALWRKYRVVTPLK